MTRGQMKFMMIALIVAAITSAIRVAIHFYHFSAYLAFVLTLVKIAVLIVATVDNFQSMVLTEDAERAALMYKAVILTDVVSVLSDAGL